MSYPVAVYPIPTGSRLLPRTCIHCNQPIGVGRWDDFNGFLVTCPHCSRSTGKRWSLKRLIIMAGFFLNAFSFFFLFRPLKALILFIVAASWAVGVSALAFADWAPDWLAVVWGSVFFLAPPIIDAVALVRHELDLDRPGGAPVRNVAQPL